jgi:hypothetical protein
MKKLLLVSLALVVSLSVVLTSVSPVAANPVHHQRPQPQNCGQYCWDASGPQQLHVNTCQNDWDFDNTPDVPNINLNEIGGVRQYGNMIVVRWSGMDDGVLYRFYAIGVINGPAVVYVVYDSNGDGVLEKYTISLNWCGDRDHS